MLMNAGNRTIAIAEQDASTHMAATPVHVRKDTKETGKKVEQSAVANPGHRSF